MSEELQREARRAYHASTTFLDTQVGRVLDALDRLGLAESTVVVFHSDHGYLLGEHGLWQKQSLFERSTRVPLLIRAPGAAGNGRSTEALAELIDVYPTVASLCGLEVPRGVEGRSLVPILENPGAPGREAAFSIVRRGGGPRAARPPFFGRSVRTARFRYNEWDDGRAGVELYDLQNDPGEITNLAESPAHSETVERHRVLLRSTVPAP
jgi:arylsulfatase A-like enzyme